MLLHICCRHGVEGGDIAQKYQVQHGRVRYLEHHSKVESQRNYYEQNRVRDSGMR